MSSILLKLRVLLAMPGWTQATVARRLGVSQSTINRWTKGTAPEGDHRDALADLYAEALGLSVENNKMRVRGEIGPGQLVTMVDKSAQGWTDRPYTDTTALTALVVTDNSMLPYFAEGWILFHSMPQDPQPFVGEIVVAELSGGRQIVRKLHRGSAADLWTLTIPSASDIADVKLESVCPIVWIKPFSRSFDF